MKLPPRIVLHSPIAGANSLAPFVEQCLGDKVRLIAIVGEGAEALEDEIDWFIVGDGSDPQRLIVTSSHPKESVKEVMEFAASWNCEREGLLELRL